MPKAESSRASSSLSKQKKQARSDHQDHQDKEPSHHHAEAAPTVGTANRSTASVESDSSSLSSSSVSSSTLSSTKSSKTIASGLHVASPKPVADTTIAHSRGTDRTTVPEVKPAKSGKQKKSVQQHSDDKRKTEVRGGVVESGKKLREKSKKTKTPASNPVQTAAAAAAASTAPAQKESKATKQQGQQQQLTEAKTKQRAKANSRLTTTTPAAVSEKSIKGINHSKSTTNTSIGSKTSSAQEKTSKWRPYVRTALVAGSYALAYVAGFLTAAVPRRKRGLAVPLGAPRGLPGALPA